MNNMIKYLVVLLFLEIATSCPDLWIQLNDNCYKVSPNPMNWYSAQEYCIAEGGYQIEINDEDEQVSLYSFLTNSQLHWIGLSDAAQEGRYVWQHSYTEASYTYWNPGEPNNTAGDEDCVHLIDDFTWNDAPCEWVQASGAEFPSYDLHALCETPNK